MKKPNSFDPREAFAKAITLHQVGKFSEAEKIYKQILEVLPDLEPIYSTLGGALISQNKTDEAQKVLEKALQLNPRSLDALNNIGALYLQQNKLKQAEDAYVRMLELKPDMASAHYNLGNVYRTGGQTDKAISHFKEAIKFDPAMTQAYQNLGYLYQQTGRTQEAAMLYNQTAGMQNDRGDSACNMAYLKLEEGKYEEALAGFNKVIQQYPSHARAFAGIGRVSWEQGMAAEAIGPLEQAIALNPSDPGSYVLLANAFVDLKRLTEAEENFKKALQLQPDNEEAKSNLSRMYQLQVPRWHFIMLGDEKRNQAFQQAIERAVTPSSRVLDIGTGSGLLAMMAARAGAARVTACEVVKPLADAAAEIVKANGYAGQVNVVNKRSNKLKIGEDISEKVDVVVSEILDAGLLGEGVIPSVRHALQNLAAENAKVIPQAAQVYATLIEIPKSRLVAPVKQISGFDLSLFNRFRVESEYNVLFLAQEEHRLLGEAQPVFDVDFRHLPPPVNDTAPLHKKIKLKATSSGTVHAVAFWFTLHLDDTLSVSSGPGGEMVHWGQAVQFLERDVPVKEGDEVSLLLRQSDSLLRFSLD